MKPGHVAALFTGTFNPESLDSAIPDVGKRAFAKFVEQLEIIYERELKQPCPFKWSGAPELGELNGRLHVHGMVFHVPGSLFAGNTVIVQGRLETDSLWLRMVREAWPHGFVRTDQCHSGGGAITYVLKYVTKGRAARHKALDEWKKSAHKLRNRGKAVPSFVSSYWVAWPRGRRGGLGSAIVGPLVASLDSARSAVDIPKAVADTLSRYERRKVRAGLGLDTDLHKDVRQCLDPEVAETAVRIQKAGSVKLARLDRAHVDPDIAAIARHEVEMRAQFGSKSIAPWQHKRRGPGARM